MMKSKKDYKVIKSTSLFLDEALFKNKLMQTLSNDKENIKDVIAIENMVEPGMPDVMIIDKEDKTTFIETKYAEKGVITFRRTQIPWYMRHKDLKIIIVAYNDLTRNIHVIGVDYILGYAEGKRFRLSKEVEHEIKESL